MIELLWPAALAALPLPWLLRRLLPAVQQPAAALRLPFYREALELTAGQRRGRGGRVPTTLWLAWLLLCLAASRPVSWGELEQAPSSGRDLLLAVDVSGSMAADDMLIGGQRVDRLTAVKAVLGDFLRRRAGDRVGLILFGQQAYLLTPLTFDRESVRYQLETSAIGIAGRETAIGDAVGLAVKRLREQSQGEKVLILLTDGVNTAGALTPEQGATLAQQIGLRVHTIGIGGEGQPQPGLFGLMLPQAPAEIDEPAMRKLAESTGGRYFRARDTGQLVGIYAELDRLEPVAADAPPLRSRQEWFVPPLALALLLAALNALRARALSVRRSPQVPA